MHCQFIVDVVWGLHRRENTTDVSKETHIIHWTYLSLHTHTLTHHPPKTV